MNDTILIVATWTGREVRALRTARRMSMLAFAEHLGVSERMVSKWEAAGEHIRPRPVNQHALDVSLNRADELTHALFRELRSVPVSQRR